MDGPSESSSALPWLWVIEALAGFGEISTSTLQELIDVAPVVPDDFCKNTRELVALRCLEELFGSAQEINPDASSSLDSRVGFDISRSCEDVLQEILDEIPLSNLKVAGAELSKWDVFPFITHKRSCTIKCELEQLKESIFEGTHPYTDYLRERSGLAQGGYPVRKNNGECNHLLEKDSGNSTYAENMGAKGNSVSLTLENGNESSREDLLDNNFLPSKRNRVDSADEHVMGDLHEKQVCINESDDFLRNSKKMKCFASANFESKREKPEQDNKAILGKGLLEDSQDRCTASNRCTSSRHNEVLHNESNIPFNATVMPQHTSGGENCQQQQFESIPTNVALPDEIQKISGSEPWSKNGTDMQLKDPNGSQHTVAADKAHGDTGNCCGVEISGERIVYQDENFLMKKHEVLIPQCILDHDSLAFTELTLQNPGMKCNEGDRLLVCDTTTFPLVASESCPGMTTTILPRHTSGDEPCQNTSLGKTKDDTENHVEPIPTNVDGMYKIRHMNNESQPKLKEPNALSLIVSQKLATSDKAVVDTVNGCDAELSSDIDRYQNEKIDLAAKKHEFLSSQLIFGHDFSSSTEWTEQNLCMKCNEGGQLLICKTTTCPLTVHKNCLGVPAQFDANGNFLCPFCTYSHAISEYLEAKKKASLARKELAIFIRKGIRHQATELLHEVHRQEHSLSRKSSECEHIHVGNNGNDQVPGHEENREDNVSENVNAVNNLQFERSQQQACTSCREKGIVNNGVVEVLSREEEGDEMLNSKRSTGGRVEENKAPIDHVDVDGHDKFSCKKANIDFINQSNTGEEIPQEMLKQHNMDGTVEPICAHDSEKEEISEDDCEKHIISRYSTRFRTHETQYKPPASPQLRRKNIPWTAEEEELIREGVQKFGLNDPKIPWKKILAFGSHVFQKDDKHRTPQDLKNKWKNMCRAHSKT